MKYVLTCNKHCEVHEYCDLIKNWLLFTELMYTKFELSMNLILDKEIFLEVRADERYEKLLTNFNLYFIKYLNYHWKILNVLFVSSDKLRFSS